MNRQLPNLADTLEEGKFKGQAPWENPIREDFHVVVFKDKYPVTDGHLLFVPQYPTVSLVEDCFKDAYVEGMRKVESGEWEGFNVGLNWGECAGQTVPWPHVHLIPRKTGDTPDPVGGVRNVVEGKGNYKKW